MDENQVDDEETAEEHWDFDKRVYAVLMTPDEKHECDTELYFTLVDNLEDDLTDSESEKMEVSDIRMIETRNFLTDAEATRLSWQNIVTEQQLDKDLAFVVRAKQDSTVSPCWNDLSTKSDDVRLLCAQWDSLTFTDGTLYRLFEDVNKVTVKLQVIVPKNLQRLFVKQCHVGQTGGHLSIRKTCEQVARRAYFSNWKRCVTEVCRECEECAKYHRGKPPRQGAMQINEAVGVMDRLAIDLTGPHPTSTKGHHYILTVLDVFSRYLTAVPLRNKSALTVAEALHKHVFCRLGISRELLSDQGKEFDNEMLRQLCDLYGIRKLRTTPITHQQMVV